MLRTLLIALALLWPAAASAEWRKAVSEHFIVYGDVPEQGLRGFAQNLERFDQLLRMVTNVRTPPTGRKLTVFVVESDERVRRLTGNAGTGVVGLYMSSLGGARAIVPYRKTDSGKWGVEGVEILQHEYVHHFMWQNAPAPYPAWYREGFADYYSTVKFTDPQTAVVGTPARSNALYIRHAGYAPWNDILTYGSGDASFNVYALYAQGWMVVHAMATDRELRGKVNAYLAKIADGSTPADAYKAAFGDGSYFSDTMRAYTKKKEIGALQLKLREAPAAAAVAVGPVSRAEDALLDLAIRLSYAEGSKRVPDIARDIAAKARVFPGDAYALELSARAALLAGDRASAAAAADALVKSAPGHGAGMLYKGLSLAAAAEASKDAKSPLWREARSWIVKANAADPDNPQILFSYYRTFADQGAPPPANATEALTRAFELYPQNGEVRLAMAADFERRERYADALAVLKPLANNPHRGEGEGELEEMLKRLQAAMSTAKAADGKTAARP